MASSSSFQDQFQRSIAPVVNRFCQNVQHPNMELECRLGNYDSQGHFDTNVGSTLFHHLLAYHSRSFDPVRSSTTIYRYDKDDLRTDSRFPSTFIKKTSWEKVNFPEYNCRVALSNEEPIKLSDTQSPPAITYTRQRERWSFRIHPHLRLDLTQVSLPSSLPSTLSINTNPMQYQVELELLYSDLRGHHLTPPYLIALLTQGMEKLLKYAQNTAVLLSSSYQQRLDQKLNEIATKIGRLQTYQPRTFHREDLKDKETMFAMTDKIDGRRALLFVGMNGLYVKPQGGGGKTAGVPWKCFGQTDDKSIDSFQHCISEGDLTDRKFYAFDMVVYRDEDLRMNPVETLPRRLEKLKTVVEACYPIHGGTIELKTYYFGTIPDLFATTKKCILQAETEACYSTDGLIFTPMREPHPKHGQQAWRTQLKWKPEVTLDVRCQGSENQYPLVVGESGAEEILNYKYNGATLRFDLYPKEADQYKGQIVECSIQSNGVLHILRTRPDKMRPNYVDIILDNIKAIEFPVTYEHITGNNEVQEEYDPEHPSYSVPPSPSPVMNQPPPPKATKKVKHIHKRKKVN